MAPMIPSDEVQTAARSRWTLEEELERNKNLRKEDVNILRDFCLSLPKVDPSSVTVEVLVAFLHVCNFDLEQAQNIAAKYFNIRVNTPEVFTDRHVGNDDVGSALEVGYFCALPRRTPEGFRLVMLGLRQPDPSLFHYTSSTKVQILTVDSCIHEDPTSPGYVFIYDMNGVSMGHMFKWSLGLTRKIMKYLHEGVPLRIQQMHFINANSLTYKILQILKPFISTRLWDMFKLHQSSKMETFWEYVPKECLPKEYGGHLPDLESLHKDHVNWLRRMQPRVDKFY